MTSPWVGERAYARVRRSFASEPTIRLRDSDSTTRRFLVAGAVTLLTTLVLVVYLIPFGFMTVTALKSETQIADPNAPLLPLSRAEVVLDGAQVEVFDVDLGDRICNCALVKKGREASTFIDMNDPTGTPIEWEGRWRQLTPSYSLDLQWDNFERSWDAMGFLPLLRNTVVIAALGILGTTISSTLVAYGLSRFRVPFKGLVMASLVATIILPRFVTLIPTYAVFNQLGMVGTWWPLILPHAFANAYNVFLLRQFFLSIPRDLDEAAAIDGAGPIRILMTVILPQAKGAIVAVGLFHFFYTWNDFFEPLVYLSASPELQPISVGLTRFLGLYDSQQELIQAGALIGLAIPLAVFMLMQRVFLSGIDVSGAVK